MDTDDRPHRPALDRKGPRRSVYAAPGGAGPAPARQRPAPRSPTPATAAADVVIDAVEIGYDVLENNIELGRQAAERLRSAVPPRAPPAQDAKVVASRLMHLTKDLGSTWVELCVAVLRDPDLRGLFDRAAPPGRAGAHGPSAPVTQRIRSRKAVEIALALDPAWVPSASPPKVAGLHALDGSASPIRSVAFLVANGGLILELEVPDDQPPEVYSGAVVDTENRRAVGTLTVQVLD